MNDAKQAVDYDAIIRAFNNTDVPMSLLELVCPDDGADANIDGMREWTLRYAHRAIDRGYVALEAVDQARDYAAASECGYTDEMARAFGDTDWAWFDRWDVHPLDTRSAAALLRAYAARQMSAAMLRMCAKRAFLDASYLSGDGRASLLAVAHLMIVSVDDEAEARSHLTRVLDYCAARGLLPIVRGDLVTDPPPVTKT
jgi:hypothetical protein